MTNIGREVRSAGRVLGTVVEEITVRGKPKLKIRLADDQPRNPVLGDFAIVGINCEFVDDPVFAEPANIGYVDMRVISRRQSYNR